RRIGDAERQRARAGRREQRVAVSVVAARALDDVLAARDRAREAERGHRRLGARRDEPDAVVARQRPEDAPGELRLLDRRRAEDRPAADAAADAADDARV